MKNILKVSFLGLVLLSMPVFASAANPPTSAQQQPTTQDQKTCKDVNSTSKDCTRKNSDGTVTTCGGSLGPSLDYCKVTYPDNSYTTITPNGFAGATLKNYNADGTVTGTQDTGSLTQGATGTLQTQANNSPTNSGANCPLGDVGCYIKNGLLGWVAQLFYFVLTIMGWMLGLVGKLFNWAVVVTVFQFGAYFANSEGMLTAWGILRDLANIVILFGFIFVGIMMILDVQSFNARHTLPRLLIFAVLLNFSLFIGEAVVDVTNVLSAQLFKEAGSGVTVNSINCGDNKACSQASGAINSSASNGSQNVGIAGIILQDAGVGDFLKGMPANQQNLDPGMQALSYAGMIILLLVLIAVLLAGTIMLFTRAVMLSILLLVSPIAFAGMAIPQLEGRGKEWWQKLLSNAFFAPIYLLLIFVGLKVMEASTKALGGSSGAGNSLLAAVTQNGTASGDPTVAIVIFAMLIGFMVAAFMFARASGTAGAAFATNFAQSAVQRTLIRPATMPFRAAGSGAAWVGRTTAGNAARFSERKYSETIGKMREKGGATGFAAKVFDDMYGHNIEHAAHTVQTAKIGGKSNADDIKNAKERKEHTLHAAHNAHYREDLDSGNRDRMETAAQKMPFEDLEKYLDKNSGKVGELTKVLSTDKFEKLMESKNISSSTKDAVLQARHEALAGLVAGGYANKDEVRKLGNDELAAVAKYNPSLFQQIATTNDPVSADSLISGDQYNALKGNKALTQSQRDTLAAHTQGGMLMAAIKDGDADRTKAIASKMGTGIADLPVFVLKNENVIETLDKSKLQNIASKNKLSDADKADIMKIMREQGLQGRGNYKQVAEWLSKNQGARQNWGEVKDIANSDDFYRATGY